MTNSSALQYWKYTGYTAEALHDLCRSIDERFLFAKVEFRPGKDIHTAISQKVGSTGHGHPEAILAYLREIYECYGKDKWEGIILIMLEDGLSSSYIQPYAAKVPILSFGNSLFDSYSLLIPDPAFLFSRGYQNQRVEINDLISECPWDKKEQVVFWRGSGSGSNIVISHWDKVARVQLSQKSKEYNKPEKLDAYISLIVDCGNREYKEGLVVRELLRDQVDLLEMLRYRYQIDIDGEHSAWKSYFLKLSAETCVLKIQTEKRQWYYERLIPWRDYIPVQQNMSDLYDAVEWAHAHDEQCHEIARNAYQVMSDLSYESSLQETGALIEELLQYEKD